MCSVHDDTFLFSEEKRMAVERKAREEAEEREMREREDALRKLQEEREIEQERLEELEQQLLEDKVCVSAVEFYKVIV